MNTENMIDVSAATPMALVKAAYALSSPQGLGFIHARDGELSDEDAQQILSRSTDYLAARMDYVHGRSCKFAIYKHDGKLWINRDWYDHGPNDVKRLLEICGIEETGE